MASYKDYKSISAAKKAGSIYYTNKAGKKMLAVTKEDLEQPVVSAAVARAYFMVAADAIPTEPEAMADYYVDNYVRYDPKSPTYKEDREKARQNFLVNNGFVRGGFTQTIKSLLDI